MAEQKKPIDHEDAAKLIGRSLELVKPKLATVNNPGLIPALPRNPYVDGYFPPGFAFSFTVDNGGAYTDPGHVFYCGDCADFTPASGSDLGDFDAFVKAYFRPCVIAPEDSEPKYYLQHDNFTLKTDGTPANLDGTDGDVMIQVKKLYARAERDADMENVENGNFIADSRRVTFTITDNPESAGFCFTEFEGEELDYIYVGAYEASNESSTLRSITKDSKPQTGTPLSTFRNYAKKNGDAYHLRSWKTVVLWRLMFMLLYKTRASTALGYGLSSANYSNPGIANDKPFCYGDTANVNEPVKFLGLENCWGNYAEIIDGVQWNSSEYKVSSTYSEWTSTAIGNSATSIPHSLGTTARQYTLKTVYPVEQTDGFIDDNPWWMFAYEFNTSANYNQYFCDQIKNPSSSTYSCVGISNTYSAKTAPTGIFTQHSISTGAFGNTTVTRIERT